MWYIESQSPVKIGNTTFTQVRDTLAGWVDIMNGNPQTGSDNEH